MLINRAIYSELLASLKETKLIHVIYGPRQVGKTTLIQTVLKHLPGKHLIINADDIAYHPILSSQNKQTLEGLVSGYDLLYIDEAQRIPNVGINLKIIYDSFPDLKVVVTGSSSFELANSIKEPLTGRTKTYQLFPLSFLELAPYLDPVEKGLLIEEACVYGTYPAIWTEKNIENKKKRLQEITSAYLYKDVLEISSIKHTQKLQDLLQLIAYQIGAQVSLSELGSQLGMHKETVGHYIDLLEKSFVLFRLRGFSRNLRKEISKMDKLYFFDLGIRNALIQNFTPFSKRPDKGALWENYAILERKKLLCYRNRVATTHFWRTYSGSELDYIEQENGHLSGFEFKSATSKKGSRPTSWSTHYPDATFSVITPKEAAVFLTEEKKGID